MQTDFYKLFFNFYSDESSSNFQCCNTCARHASERVQHQVARGGRRSDASLNQRHRFLRRVFSELLLITSRCRELPDSLHLLAAVLILHVAVVEDVVRAVALFGFRCPIYEFCRVRECAATEVGRWIGFLPYDVVEHSKSGLDQRHPCNGMKMKRPANPHRSGRFEDPKTLRHPFLSEFEVLFPTSALVPIALVNAHHLPCVTCDTATRKKIRRVGPNTVKMFVR